MSVPDFPAGCDQCFGLGGGWIADEGWIVGYAPPIHAPDCVAAKGVPF